MSEHTTEGKEDIVVRVQVHVEVRMTTEERMGDQGQDDGEGEGDHGSMENGRATASTRTRG